MCAGGQLKNNEKVFNSIFRHVARIPVCYVLKTLKEVKNVFKKNNYLR